MAYCKHPEEACCNMTLYGGKIYCDDPNGFCHLHDTPPPITNADRIREMSDEELAELLGKLVHCGGCPMRDNCKVDNLPCNNVLFEWLKQPATEDLKGEIK